MEYVLKNIEETDISYEQLVSLMHESFRGYLDAGIHFTCSSMTVEWLKRNLKGCIVTVALNPVSTGLVGMYALRMSRNNRNNPFSYLEYILVSPEARHCGVGSFLIKDVIDSSDSAGCGYVLSDTSCLAKEAADFHLRNGFRKVGITSFKSTDYWSYKLRYQIRKPSKWNCSVYCGLRFMASCVFVRLLKDSNGNNTKIGNLFYTLICRNCH